MGPYLAVPRKEKDSVNGENSRVNTIFYKLALIFLTSLFIYSLNMEQQACKAGETQWKTPTLLVLTSETGLHSSEFMMDMEVS